MIAGKKKDMMRIDEGEKARRWKIAGLFAGFMFGFMAGPFGDQ